MARASRRGRRWERPLAAGFTLLEVVVAIAILGVTVAAIGPQMLASIRASGTAKLVSQAKGVLQGQLDAMRTLPFRVTPAAGDHRDMLDTYYRNLSAPSVAAACGTSGTYNTPLASWIGYVPANSAARCSYEPAAVPIYRTVLAAGTGDIPASFAVVIDTTFVSAGAAPVVLTPMSGFDTQVSGKDRPPSSQVGVTATVLYKDHKRWKPFTVYTQIASRTPSETRIKLEAHSTAVQIGSARADGETLSLMGGQLDLTGSLSTTSQARASLAALSAASSSTGRQYGATISKDAPYTNLLNVNASVGDLASGCSDTCWGASLIPPFVLAADNGLPRAGVSGLPSLLNPVQTQVPDNITRDGFQFRGETPTLQGLGSTLVSMDATPPVGDLLTNLVGGLYNCAFSLTGPTSHLTGSGYINSTDELAPTGPLSAEACGGAHSDVIRILPTTIAPDGLIRIVARSAAKCTVSGVAHTTSTNVSYRAEVEYWKWTPAVVILGVTITPGHGQYVSGGVITPATTTDPLASIPMTTPVSDNKTLADYIDSMTGLTASQVTNISANHVAQVTIPALITVQTQPVAGAAAPATAVSIGVGASSCYAEDNR